ncbi:MAG: ABC transporter permease subunit [Candidatus Saccharimonas sp.]
MNIYRQELKMLRGSFIVWGLAILALATIYLSVYPAFSSDVDTIKEVFAHLPQAVKNAMGTGGFEIFTFPGFIANILPILLLAGSIQAMNMGITMTNREKLAQTTDFLLAKPVRRSRIFWHKLLAHLTIIFGMGITLTTYIYLGSAAVGAGDYSLQTFIMIMAVFTGIQLWFLSVGLLVSALVGRIRAVIGISMAVAFGLFVLAMFGSFIGDETIRYMTPFKYIDLLEVVKSQHYELAHVILWVGIVVASITLSWMMYARKDVHS